MVHSPSFHWARFMTHLFHRHRFFGASCFSLICLLTGLNVLCLPPAQAQTEAPAMRPGAPVTLNFADADIASVARAMANITGRNVVVDPRVKGTLTLNTESPVTPNAAYNLFLAALRLQGFTVVQSAGLDKVVPEADAKLQSGTVFAGTANGSTNQIVTQIFRLNFENANNLVPVLRPLISPNNTINVNPGTNSLVITDYADNLQRIARIIAALDVSNAADIDIIPLKHALASDLAPLVTRLVDRGTSLSVGAPQGQGDSSQKISLIAEPRSNALILRTANPEQTALVKSLVEKLDQPTQSNNGDGGNIYVVYLKNADATKLAVTLRAALSSDNRLGASIPSVAPGTANTLSPVAGGLGGAAQTTTGGQIQADPATNSLIITAPEPQYRQLRAVIDKLDARRAQVFVESLIAEVNADKAAEFGVQWQGSIGQVGNANIGLLGTNFGSGGSNIITLATQGPTGAVAPGAGLNVGVANQNSGVYVLGFLARFLETTGDGNILSTPNLLTLDNEEAKIVIGQNVPFVTGQYTNNNVGATGAVNPFQTIERKDVGLTLRVKPQISENGTVKLTIFQEVSSVQASSINSPSGLITNKRSIESSVLVNDGAIVVLGGLLQDTYAGNQEKVPGLADIPLLGFLFKSETRSRQKTNLMVFLRPVVVRDAASSDALAASRYEVMRGSLLGAQPAPSVVLPINEAATLPFLPAPAPGAAAPARPASSPASGTPAN
jgi:general secretion pathway protein D